MWRSRVVACAVLCLGCAPADTQTLTTESTLEASTIAPVKARFIIKFTEGAYESSPAFLGKLSKDAGTVLVYVRPVSVGGHVFECRDVYSSDELAEVIQRLTKRKDVVYAEEDRLLRHQKRDKDFKRAQATKIDANLLQLEAKVRVEGMSLTSAIANTGMIMVENGLLLDIVTDHLDPSVEKKFRIPGVTIRHLSAKYNRVSVVIDDLSLLSALAKIPEVRTISPEYGARTRVTQ